MQKITLEQILMLYYFRKVNERNANGEEYDNDVVRVYYDEYMRHFEFGIDDIGEDTDKKEQLRKILSKEMLDREVDSIQTDYVTGMLLIYLKEKENK